MDGARTSVPVVPIASVRGILFGSGPRFARDAFGPVLAFYLGWKLVGLALGIGLASVVSLLSYRHERKRERPGRIARLALVFIVVQALIGLASHSAKVYLAQPVLANAAFGLAFLVSALLHRPLAGMFAQEMHDFPPEVRSSATFNAIFTRISMAWGCYLLMRSATRLLSLSMSVERFLVVNLVTGLPLTAGMITWSVWYSVRSFRRSQEWGWAFEEGVEAASAGAASAGAGPDGAVTGGVVTGGVVDVALAPVEETPTPRPAAGPA